MTSPFGAVSSQVSIKTSTVYEITRKNPILRAGEPFYESDTHAIKVGDGIRAYKDLPYAGVIAPEFVLTSPDGTMYRLKVANGGALSTEAVV
jgi:hypothetical protein